MIIHSDPSVLYLRHAFENIPFILYKYGLQFSFLDVFKLY